MVRLLGKRGLHLKILPRADSLRTKEHRTGRASPKGLLQGRLPLFTWHKVPLVEEGLELRSAQTLGQCYDGRLISAAVAEENVVERASVLWQSNHPPGNGTARV